MARHHWLGPTRVLVSAFVVGSVLVVAPVVAQAAQAAQADSPGRRSISPVAAITLPAAGVSASRDVPRGPSLAARPVEARAVGPAPPAATIPAGQTLINQVAADAQEQLGSHGLVTGGRPDLGVHKLMPATDQAGTLSLSRPTADALGQTVAKVRGLTGADQSSLPEGIPFVTYRLCAESATLAVSCSTAQPLMKPTAADVTGDGTPDIIADVTPMKGAKTGSTLRIGVAVRRLSTSETQGRDLKAQVWVQYDVKMSGSGTKRISIGFDGYRRGSSLSALEWGVYSAEPGGAGATDVRVSVRHDQPGASAATVVGIAELKDRKLIQPVLVSMRQSPVPDTFTAHARLDSGMLNNTLEITTSNPTKLDALALVDGPGGRGQFSQIVVDSLASRMTAEMTRAATGGTAGVHVTSANAIGRAVLRSYIYAGGRIEKALTSELTSLPADFRARVSGSRNLSVDTRGGRAKTAVVSYFDRAAAQTVLQANLDDLPSHLNVTDDSAANRLLCEVSSRLGSLDVTLQRNGGAIARPDSGHVTMIKDGGRYGVSARLTGLTGLDVTYGARPEAALRMDPGERPFLVAAGIDGKRIVRLELSSTPARIEMDLDPAAKKAAYRTSGVIPTLRAAYADIPTGPTIDISLQGLRGNVAASWNLGDRTTAEVTSSYGLKKIDLYASRAYVTRISPVRGEDIQTTVEGVGKHVSVLVDTPRQRLDWTADAPVTSLDAFARVNAQGRYFRAAARVTGVPARFSAEWGGGTYRFLGVSGPIGSATVAVTNHDGALAPTGPHLAAHYNDATKDVDASVMVAGLSRVEFGESVAGFTADFQAARQTVALDADVRLSGDLRFGALGTLGPVPGHIQVTATSGGPITYDSGGVQLDLAARVWLGKVAGIPSAAPAIANGVSLVDGGCAAGAAGCARDGGPFCTATRGCFGVRGYIDVTGLPARVAVDVAKKTFTFSGYRPKARDLQVYLASTVLAPVPVKALATLTGLPESITSMSVGPFDIGRGKDAEGRDAGVIKADYRVEPAATITSLKVRAEADTGDAYGIVRGEAELSPVPSAVAVHGVYGKKTQIRVTNAAAVKTLAAKVTVVPRTGRPGTGLVRFTDVPPVFGIDADAAGQGLGMPAFTYRATNGANTLDGLVEIQGALVARVYRPRQGELLGASVAVTDLASDTHIKINPDLSAELVSKPVPTKLLEVHAGLSVAPVKRQRVFVRQDVPYTGGIFAFQLNGAFGLHHSTIKDVSLGVHDVSWLRIRPGRIPFGMKAPSALGYISPGFEGGYDHLDLRTTGVKLNPDVNLNVKIDRSLGPDAFKDTLKLGPATSLQFRRYDTRLRPISSKQPITLGTTQLACLTVDTNPGYTPSKGTNSITLHGADGPQMLSLLDPGGQAPGYAIDLLSHFMSPFAGADLKISALTPGHCEK